MRLALCTIITLFASAVVAGEQAQTPVLPGPKLDKPRECSSCTARHQALLRRKKLREQKRKEAEQAAKKATQQRTD